MVGADRGALLTAGETLRSLPGVAALFTDGALTWGQVRRIVTAARRVGVEQRAELDARIVATHTRDGGLDAYNPDDLCDAVDRAVDVLRGARNVERKARGEFLSLQSDLQGGLRLYGQLGAVSAAIFLSALAAMRPDDDDDDAGGGRAHDAPGGDATEADAPGGGPGTDAQTGPGGPRRARSCGTCPGACRR
jgi:hypothetical protein